MFEYGTSAADGYRAAGSHVALGVNSKLLRALVLPKENIAGIGGTRVVKHACSGRWAGAGGIPGDSGAAAADPDDSGTRGRVSGDAGAATAGP